MCVGPDEIGPLFEFERVEGRLSSWQLGVPLSWQLAGPLGRQLGWQLVWGLVNQFG